MGSWSKGFMAGCATVLAAVMLISVFMLPSIDTIVGAIKDNGASIVSSVFEGGGSNKSSPYEVDIEFLNADNIGGAVDIAGQFISNGFDEW